VKIAVLSCFYPYRGGIAQFNANIFNELSKSHRVKAYNFSRQYPDFLFPGKTQFVEEGDEAVRIESLSLLDTVNPISWIKTASEIRKWNPDLLLMRYWMSWFAPSQGYVGRHIGKNTKVISVLDNVIPHEERFFDKPFTKYYLNSNDGYIVLSEAVRDQLLTFKPDAKYICTPHPVYSHFGKRLEREEAHKSTGTDPVKKTLLFFGLIREYKGLDILIDAMSYLDDSYQLVIAGEPYGSFDRYEEMIDKSPLKGNIHLFTRYIADKEVPVFFSLADVCVLPYRSATQSGISAISSHFELPLITTNVGGLKEAIEKPGTGVVVEEITPEAIASAIKRYFEEGLKERLAANIAIENEKLSWGNFCIKLIDFYNTL
jgi:glycosyltransferase involved in cell wall biosynthesis